MKSITIKGSKRESVGKVSTKALRNAEKVPCVLYGGDSNLHFSAAELAFKPLVYTPNAHTVVIELDDGSKYNAIMQDIQFHPVTDRILHVDFFQLHDDKEVTMEIPINVVGNAPGVLAGGVLRRNMRKLKVKALPKDLPDFINADISNLKIGSKLYITELLTEGYRFLHPDNTVVCQVRLSRAAIKEGMGGVEEADDGGTEATEEASQATG